MSQNESFESLMRGIAPVANEVALEQVMYRAGYESGRQSAASQSPTGRATSWYSFAKGAVSGAALSGVAASGLLILMMQGSPRQTPESTQIVTSTSEPSSVEEPMPVDPPSVVAPQRSFVSPFGEDPLERSIQQIVKQRWDRQRLSERTKWVSVQNPSSLQGPIANPSATSPKTLLELRNSTEWTESL